MSLLHSSFSHMDHVVLRLEQKISKHEKLMSNTSLQSMGPYQMLVDSNVELTNSHSTFCLLCPALLKDRSFQKAELNSALQSLSLFSCVSLGPGSIEVSFK